MPAGGVSDNIYLGRPSVLRLHRTLRLPLFLSEFGLTLGPQLLISHSPFSELGLSALSSAMGEPDKSEHHQDRSGYDQQGRGREGIEGVSDHQANNPLMDALFQCPERKGTSGVFGRLHLLEDCSFQFGAVSPDPIRAGATVAPGTSLFCLCGIVACWTDVSALQRKGQHHPPNDPYRKQRGS